MHAVDPFSFEASSLAPPTDWGGTGGCAHVVQFYEQDAFLEDVVDRFIGAHLGSGGAAVVIATKSHRLALDERLRARGLDLTDLCERGRYVRLDAAETLSKRVVRTNG